MVPTSSPEGGEASVVCLPKRHWSALAEVDSTNSGDGDDLTINDQHLRWAVKEDHHPNRARHVAYSLARTLAEMNGAAKDNG